MWTYQMVEMSVHKLIVTLLLLGNLTLAIINIANFYTSARFVWPSTMVLYDIKPVDRMNIYTSTDVNDKGAPAMEPWGENKIAGLTNLQVAKYHLGCYGYPGMDSDLKGPWESEVVYRLWSELWAPKSKTETKTHANGTEYEEVTYWAELASEPAEYQANKTFTLMKLQDKAGGFEPRSVCTCIDHLLFAKMDSSKIEPLVMEMKDNTPLELGLFGGDRIEQFKHGYGMANFWVEDDGDKWQTAWADSHKLLDYGAYGGVDNENKAVPEASLVYKKDLVDFCMTNAVPQLTTTYEGVLDGRVLYFCGILLVLVACMRDIYYNNTLGLKAGSMAKNEYLHNMWYYFTFLGAIVASVLFFVLHIQAGNASDDESVAYRGDKSWTVPMNMPSVILYILSGLVVVVELYFAFSMCSKAQAMQNKFMYHDAHYAIVFVTGWLMLGLGFLIQANIKHIQSIFVVIFLVLGACVVQFISNYFSKIYEMLFKFLDTQQGTMLQMSKTISVPAVLKMKQLFQFIAWGRLLVTITILFHVILLVTSAKESSSSNMIQTLCENQFIYYAVAFLFANCGFDVVYEILPFMFDKDDAKWVKNYFVLLYVTYVNVVLLIYTINATSNTWDRRINLPTA